MTRHNSREEVKLLYGYGHLVLIPSPLLTSSLSSFSFSTLSEISSIIWKSKSSSCKLDPLLTTLVKLCLPPLSPLIADIIHSFLFSGSVPPLLKRAIMTLILKKPGSDPNHLNNFQPIANLPFLSIILGKKRVSLQVHDHLTDNNFCKQFQSGFHQLHTTQTAMVENLR